MGFFNRLSLGPFGSQPLEELQKYVPTGWVARIEDGQMRLARAGLKTMSYNTVFGDSVGQWFESLLRKTVLQTEDFERHNNFLNNNYAFLLGWLKDILTTVWPEAWNDPSKVTAITIGPVKRGKTWWEMSGTLLVSGSLKFLAKMAHLQNELLATAGKSSATVLWNPQVYAYSYTSEPIKSGIFVIDSQGFVKFPGGPGALEKEIRRVVPISPDSSS